MLAADVFAMKDIGKMTYTELILWLQDTATLQEAHPFHSVNWPDWVPGAARFRQHAEALTNAVKATENRERDKAKELKLEHANTLSSVHLNADYIAMRWRHEKKEIVIQNTGYVLKERTKRTHARASVKDKALALKLKAGPDIGSVGVKFEKDPAAGSYHLQFCKGEPAGEESWTDQGYYKSCRLVVNNLDRACWYYFRGRSLGDNMTSPWSAPMGIIVV
jgi:hypothetical protein